VIPTAVVIAAPVVTPTSEAVAIVVTEPDGAIDVAVRVIPVPNPVAVAVVASPSPVEAIDDDCRSAVIVADGDVEAEEVYAKAVCLGGGRNGKRGTDQAEQCEFCCVHFHFVSPECLGDFANSVFQG